MLQQTINQLLDQLQHRVPASRDYQKSELHQGIPELPSPLTHFIIRRIDHRLSDHLEQLASDPWLDTSTPALSRQLDQLEQTLDQAARIPSDEWPDRVAEAAREVVTYLVDPVAELADFVFRHSAELPVSEVQERMAFFTPYSYLHSVFNAYADRQNLQSITRDRFEQVLRRIDRQMVADFSVEKWVGLFEPLYEVLAPANKPGEPAAVPVELLQQLASNKHFDALEAALGRTNQSRLTSAQLHDLIASALDSPAPTPHQQEPPRPAESTEESDSQEPQPRWKQFQKGSNRKSSDPTPRRSVPQQRSTRNKSPRKPKQQDPQAKGQPLWQRFQQSNVSRVSNQSSSSDSRPPRPDPQPSPSSRSSNGPASDSAPSDRSNTQQSSHSADSTQRTPGNLDAIEREVIGPIPNDQRKRFVRKLFSGSEDAYENILAELQSVDSWNDASSLIAERVFLPHQVNIYSEPAVTFTDLVEARFQENSSV